jgi:outer membrane protein assembly factor BamA
MSSASRPPITGTDFATSSISSRHLRAWIRIRVPLWPSRAISISVHEGPRHSLSAGAGYNTETQLNATIGWTDYDFLGGGRQLSVTGTYSNVNSTFDLKLLQPHLFSPESSLTLEASQQQQTYQTYTGNISGFDPHIDYKQPTTRCHAHSRSAWCI